ncbi:hypothetical protein L3X38_029433 [Prunus dulcis]|uniref:KEN domain-containing protein n=1 Tax=Prunus dulcis TaxID=3755 RepID=A0AAD4Z264_PRUDU|nr:hypothetical protein L3X38_029433 [Prunus dulcis]
MTVFKIFGVYLLGNSLRIHDKGLFHGGLHKRSNFVFVNKKLKGINIEGSLAGLSPPEQDEQKKKDIMDLRTMLNSWFKKILGSKYKWKECSSFLKFFDHAHLDYPDCVKKVTTRQDVEDALESSDFDKFKSWNRDPVLCSMDKFMKGVDYHSSGNYTGDVMNLLRYLRNLYYHYCQLEDLTVNVVDVDRAVQKLFAGFLELLHKQLRIVP